MNRQRIAEVEQARASITEGHWSAGSRQCMNRDAVYAADGNAETCVADMIKSPNDLNFISRAPEFIDTLLEEIERLAAQVKELGGEPYCATCVGSGELEQWPSMHDPSPGIEIVSCHDCCEVYEDVGD